MNHIGDFMQKLSATVISRTAVVSEISKVFSDRIGVPIPASMIRISGNRIRLSCPPSLRQIIYLRKDELLDALQQRVNDKKYYLE